MLGSSEILEPEQLWPGSHCSLCSPRDMDSTTNTLRGSLRTERDFVKLSNPSESKTIITFGKFSAWVPLTTEFSRPNGAWHPTQTVSIESRKSGQQCCLPFKNDGHHVTVYAQVALTQDSWINCHLPLTHYSQSVLLILAVRQVVRTLIYWNPQGTELAHLGLVMSIGGMPLLWSLLVGIWVLFSICTNS